MSSGDESDDELMSTEMLKNICDGSKSRLGVNRREAHKKICDCIKQIETEWKRALLFMLNMSKGLHKVFKAVVN